MMCNGIEQNKTKIKKEEDYKSLEGDQQIKMCFGSGAKYLIIY